MRASYFSQPCLLCFPLKQALALRAPGAGLSSATAAGGRARARGDWWKSSTPETGGHWNGIWTHQVQDQVWWGSLAFNSLSAFPGEDDITCLVVFCSFVLSNCVSEGFQQLLLFYQLLLSTSLPLKQCGGQHIPLLFFFRGGILQQGERFTQMHLSPPLSQLSLAKISTLGYEAQSRNGWLKYSRRAWGCSQR